MLEISPGGNFLKQHVNSYLCIALVCLMAFWVCLYYFTHRTEGLGTALAAEATGTADLAEN